MPQLPLLLHTIPVFLQTSGRGDLPGFTVVNSVLFESGVDLGLEGPMTFNVNRIDQTNGRMSQPRAGIPLAVM